MPNVMTLATMPRRSPSFDHSMDMAITTDHRHFYGWSRGRRLAAMALVAIMVPFFISNISLAMGYLGASIETAVPDDLEMLHTSHARADLHFKLNENEKKVKHLQEQVNRLRQQKMDASNLENELKGLKATMTLREKEAQSVEQKVEKLKQQTNASETAHDQVKKTKRNKSGLEKSEKLKKPAKKKTQNSLKKKKKPMNILLLYADDWRHDTLGAAGNTIVKTPTLDQLAKEGIRFTHNSVTTASCWSSRATLLTGLYTARHKTHEPQEWHGNWTESIYHLLRIEAGYYVGHVGKWGIWDLPENRELDFETKDEGWHYQVIDDKLWHITEKNKHDALEFLKGRDTNKPFFLNVAFSATHALDGDPRQYLPQNKSMSFYVNDVVPVPKTATQEAWEAMPYFFTDTNRGRIRSRWRYETPDLHQSMMKKYYRMVTEVDSACASVLKELKKQGELDNTLIIFTTDNGVFHGEHGLADKWYPHDESIRVPLIVRDPRMSLSKAGTLNDDFTLNVDLAPTILSATGMTRLRTMMGRDVSDLYLKKDTEWRQEFFYEHPTHIDKEVVPGSEGLVRKDYKYLNWTDYGYEQLFDLKNDPMEEHDIINSTDKTHRAVLKDMRRRFQELKTLVNSDKDVVL